jgi:cysteinyl-tRNA synthetase
MLQIYNTLSRTKEPFKPAQAGQVRMYVCGMTVYDFCHLGHARMLVSFDVVQRWLRASGLAVDYVRNITDIDDKIIRRAVETGRRIGEVTEFYIEAMHADERALGVEAPDREPRATQYVGEMLDIIGKLEQNGPASFPARRWTTCAPASASPWARPSATRWISCSGSPPRPRNPPTPNGNRPTAWAARAGTSSARP